MNVRSLITAGALITAGMLAGRVLGLLREMLLAASFGTGGSADMAIALLIIPDFVTAALIGSAASAALVPAFGKRSEDKSLALLWQACLLSLLVFSAVALLIFRQAPRIDQLLRHSTATSSTPLLLALCAVPLTAATAVITAWLQYRTRFLVPAFANVIFNSIILLALWLAPSQLTALGWGILGAAFLRLLAHMLSARRGGAHLPQSTRQWQIDGVLLRTYTATTGNGLFSLLPQYLPYTMVAMAGLSVAAFNYAFKLVLLPSMLAMTIIQLAVLPWLVHLHRKTTADAHAGTYALSLQIGWGISLCICLALSLAGQQVAELCFGYGRMTPQDIALVGRVFALGVWAMPGMVLTSLWQQIFYAHGHTRAPLHASILQAVLIVPLCWLGERALGLSGVSIAYAVVQTLSVPMLAFGAVRRNFVKQWLPGTTSALMTAASLLAFAPLAWLFRALSPSPLWGVIMAGLIGMMCLALSLAVCRPIREAVLQWMHGK